MGFLLAGPRSKKAKDHRGPGPNEPTPRPIAMSSPGLTQQRSDDVCGSYVDGAGGSWLSFLASKFCYSCLFLSSGFIRSGSIPPGVLFSFPSSFSNLAFALSSLGFLLLLLFPQTLGSRSPRPFRYPCTFRIFGGRFHSLYSSVGGWGCGAQERERWCVERQVLRVILIPMDSAPQSQGRQPQ